MLGASLPACPLAGGEVKMIFKLKERWAQNREGTDKVDELLFFMRRLARKRVGAGPVRLRVLRCSAHLNGQSPRTAA